MHTLCIACILSFSLSHTHTHTHTHTSERWSHRLSPQRCRPDQRARTHTHTHTQTHTHTHTHTQRARCAKGETNRLPGRHSMTSPRVLRRRRRRAFIVSACRQ